MGKSPASLGINVVKTHQIDSPIWSVRRGVLGSCGPHLAQHSFGLIGKMIKSWNCLLLELEFKLEP
jgi:hypothetical protein